MKDLRTLMKGTKTRDLLAICLVVLTVSLLIPAMFSPIDVAAQSGEPRAKVKGNVLSALQDPGVEKTGKPDANEKLFAVVSLDIYEPMQGIEPTVTSTNSPGSPTMTSSGTTKTSGQQEFDQVKSFLRKSKLKILKASSDLSWIWVEGTVAQLENAFDVSINEYQKKGKKFYANDQEPSVPQEIAGVVVAIAGLENYITYEPLLVSLPLAEGVTPSVEVVGPPYDPYEIRNAYTFNTILASGTPNKLTGTGVNVAIIDAYGNPTMAADWTKFCTGTVGGGAGPWSGGALPTSPAISYFYPTGAPTSTDWSWALETAMDVEWVHAIAPGAKINLIISTNSTFASMLAAFEYTVTYSKGAVISMSFGARESYLPASYRTAWSTASRNAAKKGITMLASSGDWGYDSGNIIHPASDPYTVAVGGTELFTTGTYPGTWNGETAWSGSGGGKSILFAKPAWQWGPNVPVDSVRDIPDVALVADPYTGVYVYSGFCGGWWQVGGTSLSAPLWAAFIAMVDQAIGAAGSGGGIGLATPWLYRVLRSGDYLNCFHDITAGSQPGGYSAGPSYDLVTGIGTLKAWNLLKIGAKYLRVAQFITQIPNAKDIAVTTAGTMYIGTYTWPGVLYELAKGSTAPRAIFKTPDSCGITDIAVDKYSKVYIMTHYTLYKYDPTTETVSTLASGFLWGWGVFVDTNLNVYYTQSDDTNRGLYWIKSGTTTPVKLGTGYFAGVCVDSSLNVYVSDWNSRILYKLNSTHTTWTVWKNLSGYPLAYTIDLHLDTRKTAYIGCWTEVDLVDDYPLLLTGANYNENLWVDSKTGIYYVERGDGSVKYLPPEIPT